MTLLIQKIRRQEKLSTVQQESPTIPQTNDHTDGTWSETDIYEAEVFINTKDKIAYSRAHDDTIFKIGAYIPSDLPFVPSDSNDWATIPNDVEDALNILAENIVGVSLQDLNSVLSQGNETNGEDFKLSIGDKILIGSNAFIQEGQSNIFNDVGFINDFRGSNKNSFYYFDTDKGLSIRKGKFKAQDIDIETYGGSSAPVLLGASSSIQWGSTGVNRLSLLRQSSNEPVTATIQGFNGVLAYLSDIEDYVDMITAQDFNLVTDDIPEDSNPINLWFTDSRALNTVLAGLQPAPQPITEIDDGDTILQAFAKIQGQILQLNDPGAFSPTLDEILGNGNETLAHDIVISNGDVISFQEAGIGESLMLFPSGGSLIHVSGSLLKYSTNGVIFADINGQSILATHSDGLVEIGGNVDGSLRLHESTNSTYFDIVFPNGLENRAMVLPDGDVDFTGGVSGDVLTLQANGDWTAETPIAPPDPTSESYSWKYGNATNTGEFSHTSPYSNVVEITLNDTTNDGVVVGSGVGKIDFLKAVDQHGYIELKNINNGEKVVCQMWYGIGSETLVLGSVSPSTDNLTSFFNSISGNVVEFKIFKDLTAVIRVSSQYFFAQLALGYSARWISNREISVEELYTANFIYSSGVYNYSKNGNDRLGIISGLTSVVEPFDNTKDLLVLTNAILEAMDGIPTNQWVYQSYFYNDMPIVFVNGVLYKEIEVVDQGSGLEIHLRNIPYAIEADDEISIRYKSIEYWIV